MRYSDYTQALEFGANVLWNVKFHAFLSLSQEEPRPVRVSLQGTHWSVSSERIEDNLSAKVWIVGFQRSQSLTNHPT